MSRCPAVRERVTLRGLRPATSTYPPRGWRGSTKQIAPRSTRTCAPTKNPRLRDRRLEEEGRERRTSAANTDTISGLSRRHALPSHVAVPSMHVQCAPAVNEGLKTDALPGGAAVVIVA